MGKDERKVFEPQPPKYGERMWKEKLREWDNRCAKCLKQFEPDVLTRGHLLPKSQGGEKSRGNLVPLCTDCNREDGAVLAAYERLNMKDNTRLGPDDDTKALLAQRSRETGQAIQGQVSYDFTFNSRVIITDDVPGVIFRTRLGRLVESAPEYDDYRVVLDDPVFFRNGVPYDDSPVKVNRRQFEYLSDDGADSAVVRMQFAFEYREVQKEIEVKVHDCDDGSKRTEYGSHLR